MEIFAFYYNWFCIRSRLVVSYINSFQLAFFLDLFPSNVHSHFSIDNLCQSDDNYLFQKNRHFAFPFDCVSHNHHNNQWFLRLQCVLLHSMKYESTCLLWKKSQKWIWTNNNFSRPSLSDSPVFIRTDYYYCFCYSWPKNILSHYRQAFCCFTYG